MGNWQRQIEGRELASVNYLKGRQPLLESTDKLAWKLNPILTRLLWAPKTKLLRALFGTVPLQPLLPKVQSAYRQAWQGPFYAQSGPPGRKNSSPHFIDQWPSLRWRRAIASLTLFRAYSFCAVFLFRFINRNWNRRVQKERLSFERNNFHGNKMAQCLISNWKGKKYENIPVYENEIRKKNTGDFLDRLLSSPTRYFFVLSRQSSKVYSYLPAGNGERLLCCQWFRWYFDEGECAEDCLPGCSRKQGKKRKRRCSSIKKRSRPTCL